MMVLVMVWYVSGGGDYANGDNDTGACKEACKGRRKEGGVCVCARVRARACVFVRACLVYLYHTASVYSLHVPEADIRA